MIHNDDLFHAGFVSKTHGYRGHFYVNFVTEFKPEKALKGFLFFLFNDKPVPFFIEECIEIAETFALIRLEDINTKEEATELSGYRVFLEKTKWYKSLNPVESPMMLIGFSLVDSNKKMAGKIIGIEHSPAHYLLVLENHTLIPLHNDLIIEIDLKSKEIMMKIPEGLI